MSERFKVSQAVDPEEVDPEVVFPEEKNEREKNQEETDTYDEAAEVPKQTRFKKVRVMSGTSDGSVSENNLTIHNQSTVNQTFHRTFGRDTVEVVPMEHYYRNADTLRGRLMRPTLAQLHQKSAEPVDLSVRYKETEKQLQKEQDQSEQRKKFGWIEGVLVRCLLNIWGVILFLRMSWIVGQAGIVGSIAIVGLATVVTTLTTISMSAICTNGQVRGGGAYYLISRSLGPEFGGAIGLIFSVANAVAVSMYIVGFAETVRDLMYANGVVMISFDHDVRIVGALTLVLLLGITQAGMAWESKAQGFLLVMLLASILNYVVGTFLPKDFYDLAESNLPTANLSSHGLKLKKLNSDGHFSYSTALMKENLLPEFSEGENFFTVFSIFFPAATGILAGSNISGDLQNPSEAIPKGTFVAIALTSTSYMILAVMLGGHSTRFASGFYGETINDTVTQDDYRFATTGCENFENSYSSAACSLGWNYTIINQCPDPMIECRLGLKGDYATMAKVSGYEHLITAGIFAATLSSALACLVSAPKVFQALGKDKLIPKIDWFAKEIGKDREPRRAYFLTFVVSLAFILIGELNAIAPIISNFFLASYGLINYSCFSASLAKSPGFRPSFKFYNKWLALLAAFLCIAVMFIANWWAALVTFVCIVIVYKYIDHRQLDVNWGSSGQAYTYTMAMKYSLKLASMDDHVKNYRPQILCLCGKPNARPALVRLASQMTHNVSLCLYGDVVAERKDIFQNKASMQENLVKSKIKGIYTPVQAVSLSHGALSLMEASGVGKMRPNVLLMGFMHSWKTRDPSDIESYYNIIHDALTLNFGVGILNVQNGLDILSGVGSDDMTSSDKQPITASPKKKKKTRLTDCCTGTEEEEMELTGPSIDRLFEGPAVDRTIDVYWLFDEGGLTVLLPYLLTLRNYWSKAKIRVFTAGKQSDLDQSKLNLSALLNKFRIESSDIIIISDLQSKPSPAGVDKFNQLVSPFLVDTAEKTRLCDISEEDIENFKKKTNRQIRINEIIKKHSSKSDLIVVTLPIVKQTKEVSDGLCPAALYLAWLDTITAGLPPTLLLRGNQESVLTFYS